MELHLSEILKIYKPRPIQKQNRLFWIYKFLKEINKDRYEEDRLEIKRMGRILKRWQLWELPVLWKLCEESNCFGKYFWWKYKQKPSYKKPKKPIQKTLL